jgi:hypothetical protein
VFDFVAGVGECKQAAIEIAIRLLAFPFSVFFVVKIEPL